MSYYAGSRLRRFRQLQRMTLADVSLRTGVAIAQLSRIENGLVDPRISTVAKILACYDVGFADLEPSRPEAVSIEDVITGAERGARILEESGMGPSDAQARLDWKESRQFDVDAERAALATRV